MREKSVQNKIKRLENQYHRSIGNKRMERNFLQRIFTLKNTVK